jgi:hypothetical protein
MLVHRETRSLSARSGVRIPGMELRLMSGVKSNALSGEKLAAKA